MLVTCVLDKAPPRRNWSFSFGELHFLCLCEFLLSFMSKNPSATRGRVQQPIFISCEYSKYDLCPCSLRFGKGSLSPNLRVLTGGSLSATGPAGKGPTGTGGLRGWGWFGLCGDWGQDCRELNPLCVCVGCW